jgi:hypothetical protein
MKDKDKGKKTYTQKKMKSQKEPNIYTLMDDDIDMIGYQVRDAIEEASQQMLQKKEELHQKVQEHVTTLQQLWEVVRGEPK